MDPSTGRHHSTIRARPADGDELQLVRVVPFDPELTAFTGPYTCAPTRAGLTVRFHAWHIDEPDRSLHKENTA